MDDEIGYFVDTFDYLCRISSDPHWQRARDIAIRWRSLTQSPEPGTDEIANIAARLATEEWNGPFSFWRRLSVRFMDWARDNSTPACEIAAMDRLAPCTPTDGSLRDMIDHSIWYYFPAPENRANESKRGLYVALRWKRLVEAGEISQLDVDGLLGALDESDIDGLHSPGDQWRYLKAEISSWACTNGFTAPSSEDRTSG
ncbi:MAG: hypothetical protein E4H09_02735 [Spirochaetales bacterium]|nr:MAG: hypothetical protein E4H09_02735 [Spirochaetales bacterium]